MEDTGTGLDRLRRALRVYEIYQSEEQGSSREQLLREHEDLRDLLEPLFDDESRSSSGDLESQPVAVADTGAAHDASRKLPTIEGFELQEEIGRGGQGVVYRAVQVATGRTVGIKILSGELFGYPDRIARFRREIQLASQLQHPGIATVYASGTTEHGSPYYALQYVEGLSLGEDRRTAPLHGPPSIAEANDRIRLFIRVLEAVEHAHSRGIVHRDLKPSNIILDEDGAPFVVDFGLAKALARGDSDGNASLTQTGQFMGTPAYASPEQVSGARGALDERTDVYALGVILYELLCARTPYPTDGTSSEIYRHITRTEPANPSRINPAVGTDLRAILSLALRKEPRRRYPSVAALRGDLEAYLHGDAVSARRGHRLYMLRKAVRRHRISVSVIATLSLVLFGLLAFNRVLSNRNVSLEQVNRVLNLDRGRGLLASGNVRPGNALLWREHVHQPDRDSQWALRESQHRQPTLIRQLRNTNWPLARSFAALVSMRSGSPSLFLDESRLVTTRAEYDGPIFIDTADLSIVDSGFETGSGREILYVEVGPRKRLLYGGFANGVVTAWVLDPEAGFRHADTRQSLSRGSILVEYSPDQGDGSTCNIRCRPDGERIAVSWSEGAVRELDAVSLDITQEFRTTSYPLLAYDPHGTALAVRGSAGTLHILDDSRDSMRTLDADDAVLGLAWIPKRSEIWFGNYNPLQFVDPAADVLRLEERFNDLGNFEGHGRTDEHFISSPSGAVLWVSTVFGTRRASIFDSAHVEDYRVSPGRRGARDLGLPTANGKVVVSPDGDFVLNLALHGVIARIDVLGQPSPRPLPIGSRCENATIHTIHATPDGRYALLAGSCPFHDTHFWIQVVDLETWQETSFVLHAHDGPVNCLLPMQEPARLISTGRDGGIAAWSVPDLELLRRVPGTEQRPGIAWADLQSDSIAALACEDSTIRFVDLSSGREVRRLEGHPHRVPTLAFRPGRERLLSGGYGGDLFSWDLSDPDPLVPAALVQASAGKSIRALRVHRTGAVVAGNDAGHLLLWPDGPEGAPLVTKEHASQIFALTLFELDGVSMIASGDRAGRIFVWEHEGLKLRAAFDQKDGFKLHPASVFALTTHPDGRRIFSAGELGRAYMWDFAAYDGWIEFNKDFYVGQMEAE